MCFALAFRYISQNAIEDVQRRNLQRMLFFDVINPYLVLTIDRNNIVQSTLMELARHGTMDVKKPLKVVFIGEEGVDAGGVQKVNEKSGI